MGDWQTPQEFAEKCCQLIKNEFGFTPSLIIEPTCGMGNFIEASRHCFAESFVLGIELNPAYIEKCQSRFKNDNKIIVRQGNFLQEDLIKASQIHAQTLFLGNPPWVTNSELSVLHSSNIPIKHNHQGLKGIDAITGSSNFDICEWIITHALSYLEGKAGMLAMLCKTSVARKICLQLSQKGTKCCCTLFNFNAKDVFDVNVEACLLVCDFRVNSFSAQISQFDAPALVSELSVDDGVLHLKQSLEIMDLYGYSQLTWRQGVKHDCAKVMELIEQDNSFQNKLGEQVCCEREFLYPLLKSSMIKAYEISSSKSYIPMTQKKIGADTAYLEHSAPKLWNYLNAHSAFFDARKSKIYEKAPRFAMFGVGDYSYAKYKVAVSGFYKDPIFSLLVSKKPIMLDDTCYFLSFDALSDARVCMLLLNSARVQKFYKSIAFWGNKRPFSKKILSLLDINAALERSSVKELNATAQQLRVSFSISPDEFEHFSELLKDKG